MYNTKALLEKKKNTDTDVPFIFQVESNTGADGYGYIINYSDDYTISADNGDEYKIQYKVHQVYGSSDPSICEVYFTITSKAVTTISTCLHIYIFFSDYNKAYMKRGYRRGNNNM